MAIAHANKVLDWFEHLLPEEVPPEWMWPFDDILEEWFDSVSAARRAGQTFNQPDED